MQRAVISLAFMVIVTGCGSSSSPEAVRTVTVTANTTARTTTAREPLPPDAVTVVRSLKRGGLPIGGFISYTAANDPNNLLGRPGQYVSKVNFRDTRIPAVGDYDTEGGGSVETFENEADAQKRYEYVHAITSGSSLFAEYDHLRGTVFLRLSKVLTPKQAAEYERALKTIVR